MKINFTNFAHLFLLMYDIFSPRFWFVVVETLDFLVFQCLTFASDCQQKSAFGLLKSNYALLYVSCFGRH